MVKSLTNKDIKKYLDWLMSECYTYDLEAGLHMSLMLALLRVSVIDISKLDLETKKELIQFLKEHLKD